MAISKLAYRLLVGEVKKYAAVGIPGAQIFQLFRGTYYRHYLPQSDLRKELPGLKYYHVSRALTESRHQLGLYGRGTRVTAEVRLTLDSLVPQYWRGKGKFRWRIAFEGKTIEGKHFVEYREFYSSYKPRNPAKVMGLARRKFVTAEGGFRATPGCEARWGTVTRVRYMAGWRRSMMEEPEE